MSAEVLCKLIPHTVMPSKEARVSGLRAETSGAEVGLALGCANEGGYEILFGKYVEARKSSECYQAGLVAYQITVKMAIARKWPDGPRGKHWYRNLSDLALSELMDPARCPSCKGARFHTSNGRPCNECDATGKITVTSQDRADKAQIPWHEWKGGWGWRYEEIYRELARMEQEALSALRFQLSDQR